MLRRRLALAALLLLLSPGAARAENYTLLDGALAEARQALSPDDDTPLLVGLTGSALLEDWQHLSPPDVRLPAVIAADGPALQRHLLLQGMSCGLLISPLGRRGFHTQPLCAVPMDVVVVFHDGQRLYGHAQPSPGGASLLLTLPGTSAPIPLPLSIIRQLDPALQGAGEGR